jgi:hypothetical protein
MLSLFLLGFAQRWRTDGIGVVGTIWVLAVEKRHLFLCVALFWWGRESNGAPTLFSRRHGNNSTQVHRSTGKSYQQSMNWVNYRPIQLSQMGIYY